MTEELRALEDLQSFIKGRRALCKQIGNQDMDYAYRDVQYLVNQHIFTIRQKTIVEVGTKNSQGTTGESA